MLTQIFIVPQAPQDRELFQLMQGSCAHPLAIAVGDAHRGASHGKLGERLRQHSWRQRDSWPWCRLCSRGGPSRRPRLTPSASGLNKHRMPCSGGAFPLMHCFVPSASACVWLVSGLSEDLWDLHSCAHAYQSSATTPADLKSHK